MRCKYCISRVACLRLDSGKQTPEIIFEPATVFHGIVCCVTHLYVPFSWHLIILLPSETGVLIHGLNKPRRGVIIIERYMVN
jgi:hypothetical protein